MGIVSQLMKGDIEAARAHVSDPRESRETWVHLCARALVRMDEGDVPGAIGDAGEAVRLCGGHHVAHVVLARALAADHGYGEAEEEYLTALELSPGSGDVALELARHYHERRLWHTQAINVLDSSPGVAGEEGLMLRAEACLAAGLLQEALDGAERLAKGHPEAAGYRRLYARACFGAQRYRDAAEALGSLPERTLDDRMMLAEALLHAGDAPAAAEEFLPLTEETSAGSVWNGAYRSLLLTGDERLWGFLDRYLGHDAHLRATTVLMDAYALFKEGRYADAARLCAVPTFEPPERGYYQKDYLLARCLKHSGDLQGYLNAMKKAFARGSTLFWDTWTGMKDQYLKDLKESLPLATHPLMRARMCRLIGMHISYGAPYRYEAARIYEAHGRRTLAVRLFERCTDYDHYDEDALGRLEVASMKVHACRAVLDHLLRRGKKRKAFRVYVWYVRDHRLSAERYFLPVMFQRGDWESLIRYLYSFFFEHDGSGESVLNLLQLAAAHGSDRDVRRLADKETKEWAPNELAQLLLGHLVFVFGCPDGAEKRKRGMPTQNELRDEDRVVLKCSVEKRKRWMQTQNWPMSFESAVQRIDPSYLFSCKRWQLFEFHHGMGTGIRNDFGLWGGNELLSAAAGSYGAHPDCISPVLIDEAWRRARAFPRANPFLRKHYQEYRKLYRGEPVDGRYHHPLKGVKFRRFMKFRFPPPRKT